MFYSQKKEIANLKKLIDNIPISYTTIKAYTRLEKESWGKYLEEIKSIYYSDAFQFFMVQYREELLSAFTTLTNSGKNDKYIIGNILAYELILKKMHTLVNECNAKAANNEKV